MIRGLAHFKEHFKGHAENFILVGGVATYLLLDEAGASRVRPTKDLDIVLIMRPSSEFLNAIKEYVKNGGYEIQKGDKDQSTFYRFQKPTNEQFPIMIELFATVDSEFELFEGQHIVPVANEGGIESLSAILLDEEYYSIIKNNAVEKDGINILNERALIPFKAKAYLEIKERGEDSKNWKKNRGDIINLAANFLTQETREELTGKVRLQFVEFMEQFKNELTPEIIYGACNQKIETQAIINLLEKHF
jgi:DNA-binding TFAR19-related protein (PDSD5 family)